MKMKLALLLSGLVVLGILVQISIFGLDSDFLKGLLLNLIVEIIGIIAVVYLIERLLKSHEEDRKLKEFLLLAAAPYDNYVHFLAKNLSHLVKKNSQWTNESLALQLNTLIRDMDKYIDEEFVNRRVQVNIISPHNIFDVRQENWTYSQFIQKFKKDIDDNTTLFLSRYISIIPKEISDSIYRIENILAGNLFISPLDYGIDLIGNQKVQINVDDFLRVYKELGIEILKLAEYVD